MKIATKKAPLTSKIVREADIKGPIMVDNNPRSKKDMEEMSAMAFKRKAPREAALQAKHPKPILPKILS